MQLKCCLNFEHDVYLDALKNFPNNEIVLKTKKGEAIYHKSDIFKNIMWYSYIEDTFNLHAIPVDKVKKIIELNAKGEFPAQLEDFVEVSEQKIDFKNGAGQDDLTRFDN